MSYISLGHYRGPASSPLPLWGSMEDIGQPEARYCSSTEATGPRILGPATLVKLVGCQKGPAAWRLLHLNPARRSYHRSSAPRNRSDSGNSTAKAGACDLDLTSKRLRIRQILIFGCFRKRFYTRVALINEIFRTRYGRKVLRTAISKSTKGYH